MPNLLIAVSGQILQADMNGLNQRALITDDYLKEVRCK